MKPILQQPILHQLAHALRHLSRDQDPRVIGGIAVAAVLAAGGVWWYIAAHRLSAEEIERLRREELALTGRITDGVILDARTLSNEDSISPTPEVLVYSYSLAGLTYNCAQDVSTLPNEVLGFRIDQPVQVRYDPRNPGNSIIVSETWTGLWLRPASSRTKGAGPGAASPGEGGAGPSGGGAGPDEVEEIAVRASFESGPAGTHGDSAP